MPVTPGDYTLRIQLPNAALGSGRHLLYSTVVTADGDPIDATATPVDFIMDQDPSGVGYLQFAATGEVTSKA